MTVVIPITNQPNQSFRTTIPFEDDNVNLQFYISWNPQGEYWQADIYNLDTQTQLLVNEPLITASPTSPAVNWLHQFGYMDIGQAYIIPISNSAPDYPGLNDWGTNFIFAWG